MLSFLVPHHSVAPTPAGTVPLPTSQFLFIPAKGGSADGRKRRSSFSTLPVKIIGGESATASAVASQPATPRVSTPMIKTNSPQSRTPGGAIPTSTIGIALPPNITHPSAAMQPPAYVKTVIQETTSTSKYVLSPSHISYSQSQKASGTSSSSGPTGGKVKDFFKGAQKEKGDREHRHRERERDPDRDESNGRDGSESAREPMIQVYTSSGKNSSQPNDDNYSVNSEPVPPSHHHQLPSYNHHRDRDREREARERENGSIRDVIREQSINKLIKMSQQHPHSTHSSSSTSNKRDAETGNSGGSSSSSTAVAATASLTMNPTNTVVIPKRPVPVPASVVMSMMTNQLAAASISSTGGSGTAANVTAASMGIMTSGNQSNSGIGLSGNGGLGILSNSPVIKDNRKILGKTLHAAGVALIVGANGNNGGSITGGVSSGGSMEFPAIPGAENYSLHNGNNNHHHHSHHQSQQHVLKSSPSKGNLVMIDGEWVARSSPSAEQQLQLPAIPMEVLQSGSRAASLNNLVITGNTTGANR